MPFARGREPLTGEDMTEMTFAVCAGDLNSIGAIILRDGLDRVGVALVEGRPA